jgi:hypothetical protein
LGVMMKFLAKHLLWRLGVLSFAVLLSGAQSLGPRAGIAVNHLQGYWEGEGSGGKCSITITGNSLRYRAGTNWHEATFTLAAGTEPQQLHATIKDSWPPAKDAIGQVVHAIIKVEDGTLTLATFDMSQEPPKSFEEGTSKYVVKRAQPGKENDKSGKATEPEGSKVGGEFFGVPKVGI